MAHAETVASLSGASGSCVGQARPPGLSETVDVNAVGRWATRPSRRAAGRDPWLLAARFAHGSSRVRRLHVAALGGCRPLTSLLRCDDATCLGRILRVPSYTRGPGPRAGEARPPGTRSEVQRHRRQTEGVAPTPCPATPNICSALLPTENPEAPSLEATADVAMEHELADSLPHLSAGAARVGNGSS